jgi:2-polyprenyl-3-methyl-5-hydroxy-6-metoxy-1,4-benzoquinol methylase
MTEANDYVARYEREALEAERYDSRSYWDARYHRRRMAVIETILRSVIEPAVSSFLDCGCGTGEYLAIASKIGAEPVVGYDLAFNYVRRVVEGSPGARVLQGSLAALPFTHRAFDVVLCSEVLEHIPSELWGDAVDELFRVAGGTVIVTTPNHGMLRGVGNRLLGGRVARLDASVGHISIYPLTMLRGRLQRLGWRATSVRTLHVTPPVVGETARLPRSLDRTVTGVERGLGRLLPQGGNISVLVFRRDGGVSPPRAAG